MSTCSMEKATPALQVCAAQQNPIENLIRFCFFGPFTEMRAQTSGRFSDARQLGHA